MAAFVDRVVVHVAAGNGGHGVSSVHREKFKPLGGPDGGNGGPGGSVILRVDPDVTTLIDYHHSNKRKADNGGHGAGAHRNGAHGGDLVLPVPPGTVVKDATGHVVVDLVASGQEHVIARGGRGGLGNKALASPRRRAPGFALLGEPGDALDVVLELKTVADIALVGYPSAGKSSLVAALSAAKPKIADYPFTTLHPNLGVVESGETRYTVADVPGLIEGASEGKGLGLEFLRHVERCSALLHVLDCATLDPGRDPISDLDIILTELAAYPVPAGQVPLLERPQLITLNKIDVPEAQELAARARPAVEAAVDRARPAVESLSSQVQETVATTVVPAVAAAAARARVAAEEAVEAGQPVVSHWADNARIAALDAKVAAQPTLTRAVESARHLAEDAVETAQPAVKRWVTSAREAVDQAALATRPPARADGQVRLVAVQAV